MALNVGAMLIAFVAIIALLNGIVGGVGGLMGMPDLSLQKNLRLAVLALGLVDWRIVGRRANRRLVYRAKNW